MVEARWLRLIGPGIISVGLLADHGSGPDRVGRRPVGPARLRTAAGLASDRRGAPDRHDRVDGRERRTRGSRSSPVLDATGSLAGQRLTIGDRRRRRRAPALDLPAESFAAGPFGHVVLVGADDGAASRLRVLDLDAGCTWTIAVEAAVIRRATVEPGWPVTSSRRGSIATSRADLGIWRRPIDGHAGRASASSRHPIEDGRFGRTWSTEFAWSVDGDRLAVQSCGEVACRTRVLDPSTGALAAGRRPVARAPGRPDHRPCRVVRACRGLPCGLVAVDVRTRSLGRSLSDAAGEARVIGRGAAVRVVHERFDHGARRLRGVGVDGRHASDVGSIPDGRAVRPGHRRSKPAARRGGPDEPDPAPSHPPRRTRDVARWCFAMAAPTTVRAHGPDPVLERYVLRAGRRLSASTGGPAPSRRRVKTAIRAAAADATTTRRSAAATFAYDAAGSNPIGYGDGRHVRPQRHRVLHAERPDGFTMWFREQGHVFDWGTLKWCQTYARSTERLLRRRDDRPRRVRARRGPRPPRQLRRRARLRRRRRPDRLAGQANGAAGTCTASGGATSRRSSASTTSPNASAKYSTCLDLATTLTIAASPDVDRVRRHDDARPPRSRSPSLAALRPALRSNPVSRPDGARSSAGAGDGDLDHRRDDGARSAAAPTASRSSSRPATEFRAVFKTPTDEGINGDTSGRRSTVAVAPCTVGPCPLREESPT